MSFSISLSLVECLYAFQKVNRDLPDRIIMYRDGVGEGQLNFVFETELRQIRVIFYNEQSVSIQFRKVRL